MGIFGYRPLPNLIGRVQVADAYCKTQVVVPGRRRDTVEGSCSAKEAEMDPAATPITRSEPP
jgi:hypothetical protein